MGRLTHDPRPEHIPHVELVGITKRFGATVAVDGATLTFGRGTVHALIGENGAGKSTLGKIIAGVLQPDSGELRVEGRPVTFRSPRAALERGITTIAQEISLVPARSVVENVFLGLEDHVMGVVRESAVRARFDELVARSGISVPADARVRTLSPHDQQKVEILRALARRAAFIILDEPTARLSAAETASLRRVVRGLADDGTTVIFVSHFLEEVLEVSDVITIMRDGRIIRTSPSSAETYESCIEGMIGRTLGATFPPRKSAPPGAPEVLRVEGLTRSGAFSDISLTVRAGEIVVLTGLVGSGRSEVVRAIFGADPVTRGHVWMGGEAVDITSPGDAISRGVAMIPESRKEEGLVLSRSVLENVSLPHLRPLSRAWVIRGRSERHRVAQMLERAGVRGTTIDAPARSASGGNQQKLLFARWMLSDPALLIADEPTRGVDVGSKRNIYDLIARLAEAGTAVLVVSSETEEVLGLAHRIIVMRDGRIIGELDGRTATEEELVALAFGTRLAAA